jgi:hypothetical protein
VVAVGVALSAVGWVATVAPVAAPTVDGAENGANGAVSASGFAFRNVSAAAGLAYRSTDRGYGNGNEGVYAADYDRDGWTDLLAVGGPEPVLFRNEGGQFVRSGALPDLDLDHMVQAALWADADGDGRPDLFLFPKYGQPVLLRNEGDRFVRAALGADVSLSVPVTASAADYDGDGDLDVFVAQYGSWADRRPAGYHTFETVTDDNGFPNLLLENTADGFRNATSEAGIEGTRWSLAASFLDLTGDGRPDVHVGNDFNNDTVYVNRGNGTFRQVTLGAATDRNAMSSEVLDANRDGRPDLFVTNIYNPNPHSTNESDPKSMLTGGQYLLPDRIQGGNNLLLNAGNGTFEDQGAAYGVRKGGWGGAAVAADFDGDGDRDLFHSTQRMSQYGPEKRDYSYPMLYARAGDRFATLDAAERGFEDTNGRGVAALDYDRDGDVDLALATYRGPFLLYENRGADGRGPSLTIRVRDREGGPALGARVTVTTDRRIHTRFLHARADYESQDTRALHVGLAAAERVRTVSVVFPGGRERVLRNVSAGRTVVVTPERTRTVPYNRTSA